MRGPYDGGRDMGGATSSGRRCRLIGWTVSQIGGAVRFRSMRDARAAAGWSSGSGPSMTASRTHRWTGSPLAAQAASWRPRAAVWGSRCRSGTLSRSQLVHCRTSGYSSISAWSRRCCQRAAAAVSWVAPVGRRSPSGTPTAHRHTLISAASAGEGGRGMSSSQVGRRSAQPLRTSSANSRTSCFLASR